MDKKRKVTVVMAVHNDEEFLDEAINSILNQTLKNFELIIVNDNSSDNSQEIIEKFIKQDSRVISLRLYENVGPAGARNKALDIANGTYIAVQDADDVSIPTRLEKQAEFLDLNKDIYLLHSGCIYIDKFGKELFRSNPIVKFEKLQRRLSNKNAISHPTVMYRNNNYRYREKFWFAQDYDLYLRMLSDGQKISAIDECLVKYRVSNSSSSFSRAASQKLFSIHALEYYKQRMSGFTDNYNDLDTDEILRIDPYKSNDKYVLSATIKSSFIVGNYKITRIFCSKYFNYFGYINIFFIFYLLSFFNPRFIKFISAKTPMYLKRIINN